MNRGYDNKLIDSENKGSMKAGSLGTSTRPKVAKVKSGIMDKKAYIAKDVMKIAVPNKNVSGKRVSK